MYLKMFVKKIAHIINKKERARAKEREIGLIQKQNEKEFSKIDHLDSVYFGINDYCCYSNFNNTIFRDKNSSGIQISVALFC